MNPSLRRDRWTNGMAACVGIALIAVVLVAFVPVAFVPLAVVPNAPTRPASTEETTANTSVEVLDEREASYFEDEDGRPIARMTARLVRSNGDIHIEYSASAFGPGVEPPPGFEGVPGSNVTTAREIDGLLARRAMTLRVEDLDRALRFEITPAGGEARPVPQHAIREDGRVAFDARSEALAASFQARSKPLGDGRFELLVETGGHVRAHCRFVVRDGGGTILELAGVRHPLQRDLSRDP